MYVFQLPVTLADIIKGRKIDELNSELGGFYLCAGITEYLKSNMWTCLCGEVNISAERDLLLNKTLQETIHGFSHIIKSRKPIDAVHTSVSTIQRKAKTINHQFSAGKRPGKSIRV